MIATGVHSVGRATKVRQRIDQPRLTMRPLSEVLSLRTVTPPLRVLA